MPLLVADGFIADGWLAAPDGEPLPASGDVIVSFARLTAEWESLVKHDGRLGLTLPNTVAVEALDLYLSRLALIALDFPAFNDGRSFSIARQLRSKGYAGELRALGNVLPDQLQFMRQVGFTSFEVGDRFSEVAWLSAMRTISLAYQHGLAGEAAAVWKARQFRPDMAKTS